MVRLALRCLSARKLGVSSIRRDHNFSAFQTASNAIPRHSPRMSTFIRYSSPSMVRIAPFHSSGHKAILPPGPRKYYKTLGLYNLADDIIRGH